MRYNNIYQKIHNKIEAHELRNISNREMAEKLGCTVDTYSSNRRGEKKSETVNRLFVLLNYLTDEEIIELVRGKMNGK